MRLGKYLTDALPKEPAIVAALLTVLLMNLVFHLSRRATSVLLVGMRCMLLAYGPSRDPDKIPDDPRTVVNQFDLDPRCTSYVQCPVCYALYPYTGTIASMPPELERCTHKPTPTSPRCDVPLWEERRLGGNTVWAPRRKYIHQSLKEWVGRLLTRPGVEELMREPCDRPEAAVMEDIWDGPVLRKFRDPNGEPFFRNRSGELRLAFSLNADGFHPLHMLEAKQNLTCTAVYMVILNFPPALRYLFRNMYLAGIIPGPGKPSLDQINHVLSLLVLELLDFWKGVFYTITFASSSGLLAKGALIPLVCDMLAARQLCGLGSATSTWFCTFCLLTIQEIKNLNKRSWPPRDLRKQIQQAESWRDSQSEADRDDIFKACGVRWSVLLDLPYWNPILFSVVDSMHAAYLGLVHAHCRKVWRINVSTESGDGTIIKPKKTTSRPSDRDLLKWLTVIHDTDTDLLEDELLKDCPKDTLWHICVDNDLRNAGTRKQLVDNIVTWVSTVTPALVTFYNAPSKRSRSDPGPIKLADRTPFDTVTDDNDGSTGPESSADEADVQLRRKLEKVDKAFVEHRIGESALGRLKNSTLRAMCRTRGLGDDGTKSDLVGKLIHWVRNITGFRHVGDLTRLHSVIFISRIRQNQVPNHAMSLGETFWRQYGTI